MLPEQNSKWKRFVLFRYVYRLFRKHFHQVWVHGMKSVATDSAAAPLVFFSTHETWWDGFWDIPLMDRLHLDHYTMMEEANLRKFPFFRGSGVFGVNLETPTGRAAGLLHAVRVLRRPPVPGRRRALFLFPHGRLILPWEQLSAHGQPGLDLIQRQVPNAEFRPLAKLIFYRRQLLPEAHIVIGPPVESGPNQDWIQILRQHREWSWGQVQDPQGNATPAELISENRKLTGQT